MFFTNLGRLIGGLALVFGAVQVLLGLSIANEWMLPYEEALRKYSTKSSSGEMINHGIYIILFGVLYGMLAEIRMALRDE